MTTPDKLTLDDCDRRRTIIKGVCSSCGTRELWLHHERQRKFWRTPIKRLFEDGKLVCGICRKPFGEVRAIAAGNLLIPGETLAVWSRGSTP